MFTQKQIEFMKKKGLQMDFSRLTGEDYIQIEDRIGDVYTEAVEDSPEKVTDEILMCESILDKLSEDDEHLEEEKFDHEP